MIKAILAGQKTQTRRIVKPQPELCHGCQSCGFEGNHFNFQTRQAYTKGDRLWVRETWRKENGEYVYAADSLKTFGPWKSPIFMPREASRISLTMTEVRIEQLQEISEEDALREGVQPINIDTDGLSRYTIRLDEYGGYITSTAKEAFYSLWKDINGEKSWNTNPWCWVISFSLV